MGVDTRRPALLRRLLRYAAVENLAYWLTGAIAWVPWFFSDAAGMAAMVVVVPITVFIATLYCLKRVPEAEWKKEIWIIGTAFAATCGLIDLFFWVLWRGNNALEWYLPTTILGAINFFGYLEIVAACFAAYRLVSRPERVRRLQQRIRFGDRFVVITGVVLFLFSLTSAVMFW